MGLSNSGSTYQEFLEDANKGFSHPAITTVPGILSIFLEDPAGSIRPITQHASSGSAGNALHPTCGAVTGLPWVKPASCLKQLTALPLEGRDAGSCFHFIDAEMTGRRGDSTATLDTSVSTRLKASAAVAE